MGDGVIFEIKTPQSNSLGVQNSFQPCIKKKEKIGLIEKESL